MATNNLLALAEQRLEFQQKQLLIVNGKIAYVGRMLNEMAMSEGGISSTSLQGYIEELVRLSAQQSAISTAIHTWWSIKQEMGSEEDVHRLYVNGKHEWEEVVLHGSKEAVERVATFLASASADEDYQHWTKQGKDEDGTPFIRYGEPHAWNPLNNEESYTEVVTFKEE